MGFRLDLGETISSMRRKITAIEMADEKRIDRKRFRTALRKKGFPWLCIDEGRTKVVDLNAYAVIQKNSEAPASTKPWYL